MFTALLTAVLSATFARAHLAPFHKSMYALNGVSGATNLNNDDVVHPLYQLTQDQWWLHAYNNVPDFPPADGEFLELPAGKSFTVEIASNRGETTLSFDGQYATDWPDGHNYPEDYNVPTCITSPNMHTQNETRAAGTAFAIAYTSDIKQVTPENLAVFTVRYHTPWKRVTSYDVPAGMPTCPSGGCICAWGWVPNGCGQPNMYQLPYRCKVTGATSTKAIGTPKPPVWCETNPGGCTSGPKQMIYWNQLDGNNIAVDGLDANGEPKSPAYNAKCGFSDGAQDDIFTGASTGSSPASSSSPPPPPPPSSTGTKSSSPSSNSAPGSGSNPNGDAVSSGAKTPAASSSAGSAAPSASASASAQPVCKARKARRAQAAARRARSLNMHRKRASVPL